MIEITDQKFFHRTEEHSRYSEGDFIRLKDGNIMFVVTRYNGPKDRDSSPADVIKYILSDNGRTWSEPEVIIRSKDHGILNFASCNLVRLNNGDIGLLCTKLTIPPSWVVHIVFLRSSDEGKTWSEPVNTLPQKYEGKFFVNNARLVKLSNGRLIYPLSLHCGTIPQKYDYPYYGASNYTVGSAVFSDDDGKTWTAAEDYACPPFTKTHAGIQEGCIWEINPGVLKLLWRSDKMYQYESVSFDNGSHWSVPTPSCFTAPCSPITILKNEFTQKTYAIWNPIPQYNRDVLRKPSRTPLVIAEVNNSISEFKNLQIIENDPTCAYCYMSGIFTSPDELILSYSSGVHKDYGLGAWSRYTISTIKFREEKKQDG